MIKPYYEEDGITIYHGDCREILPELEHVDLVLTDPPYGIGLNNHDKGNKRRSESYYICGDENQEIGQWLCNTWEGPLIVFANPQKPWAGKWRQYLVWDKGPAVGGGGDIQTCWKYDWELIQIKNTGMLNGKRDSSVIRKWVTPAGSLLHPAQKPVELFLYLMGKVKADSILDPFMGSGTTLVAAKQLGRKAIGIEIEEKYCEIAVKRLAQGVLDFAS